MAPSQMLVLLLALAFPSASAVWTQSASAAIASTSGVASITGAGSAAGAGSYIYLTSTNCASPVRPAHRTATALTYPPSHRPLHL